MSDKENSKANWYVVHTYSGYENKVKANLEKAVENQGVDDIIEIKVPLEDVIEIKDGKRKTVQKKKFPGYVIVKMIMNDESWYIVRNTRGVTGFVGPGSKPIPLTEAEVRKMGVETAPQVIGLNVGETIIVNEGPLIDLPGEIEEVMADKGKVKVKVSMFGRDTSVELDFHQVRKR